MSGEVTEDVRAAVQSTQVLVRMANDLLDMTRLEYGKLPLQLATHDLSELARAACSAMGGFERGRNMEVEIKQPSGSGSRSVSWP